MFVVVQGLLSATLVVQGYAGGTATVTEQSIFSGGVGQNQKIITQGYGDNSSSSPANESIFSGGLGIGQRLITQGYLVGQTQIIIIDVDGVGSRKYRKPIGKKKKLLTRESVKLKSKDVIQTLEIPVVKTDWEHEKKRIRNALEYIKERIKKNQKKLDDIKNADIRKALVKKYIEARRRELEEEEEAVHTIMMMLLED